MKDMAHFEGLNGELRAGYRQRERQDLVYMPLSVYMGGVIWGFGAKARLINSNQKSWGFGRLLGGLI